MRHVLVVAAFLATSCSTLADLRLTSFTAGLFLPGEVELAPGERLLGADEVVKETRQIPAEKGVKFGIRFSVEGKNPTGQNQVKYFYLTPGITAPNGVRHDKYEVVQQLAPGAPYHTMAFQFSENYEIVPGEWQMMIFENDRLLLKESFAVGVSAAILPPPAVQPKTLESVIQAR